MGWEKVGTAELSAEERERQQRTLEEHERFLASRRSVPPKEEAPAVSAGELARRESNRQRELSDVKNRIAGLGGETANRPIHEDGQASALRAKDAEILDRIKGMNSQIEELENTQEPGILARMRGIKSPRKEIELLKGQQKILREELNRIRRQGNNIGIDTSRN